MRAKLIFVVIVILFSSCIKNDCSVIAEQESGINQPEQVDYQPLLEEIRFEYNSIFRSECVFSSTLSLNLTTYNSISLFFSVIGEQSDNNGIKVIFLIEGITTQFIIDRDYQDGSNHNIVQPFSLPSVS